MTLSSILALLGVWAALLITPGPDTFQLIRVGSRSLRAGILCALGVCLGNALWLTASLAGLSALIAARPSVMAFLQLAGGCVLLWMGTTAVRAGLKALRASADLADALLSNAQDIAVAAGPVSDLSDARAFRLGLSCNLSNPKVVVFFGAVFSQFIHPDAGWQWTLATGVGLWLISVIWTVGLAFAVRGFARWLSVNSSRIDIVSGGVFTFFGAFMVFEGVRALIG